MKNIDLQELKKEIETLKQCIEKKGYPSITKKEHEQLEKKYLFLSQKTDLTESERNELEQSLLRTLLQNLGKEIKEYEKELDAEYAENLRAEKYVSLNREDYYRVIDNYNLLEEKELITREGLEDLAKQWRDETEIEALSEDKLKVAWSYQAKEELKRKNFKNTTENYYACIKAAWHDIFGVICFFVGILLGGYTKSAVTSLLMIFTSMLLMKEAFETSNITVAPRSEGSYIFSYKQYSLVVGIASFIWAIYLGFEIKTYTPLIIFTIMMSIQLLCLSSYDKYIFKK